MAWVKLSASGWAQTTNTSISRDRRSCQPIEQAPPHGGPVVVGHGEQGRVTGSAGLAGHHGRPVVAQDALEAGADPLDRVAAAVVARVGGDGDAIHVPAVEGLG